MRRSRTTGSIITGFRPLEALVVWPLILVIYTLDRIAERTTRNYR
jgi:hypothetical protein